MYLAADDQYGRASVYMESNEVVDIGSLVLFDALHAPTGVRPSPLLLSHFCSLSSIPRLIDPHPIPYRSLILILFTPFIDFPF